MDNLLKFVELTNWTLEVWKGSYIVAYIMDWKYNPSVQMMPDNAAFFGLHQGDIVAAFEQWKVK